MRRFVDAWRGAARAVLPMLLLVLLAGGSGCGGDDFEGGGGGGTGGTTPPRPRPGGSGGGGAGGGAGGTGGTGGEGGGPTVELRVDEVRPPRGSLLGGDTVIINGAGFVLSLPDGVNPTDATRVYIGANQAVGARVIDDDTILAFTPPGVEGDVDVAVSNVRTTAICTGCFRYQAPVALTGIEPRSGPIHGGTEIVLHGENLRPTMTVLVGSRAALDVQQLSDGSLSAILPPGDAAGPVDVRVFDADGEAALRKGFDYVAPLRIESVSPPGGPMGGGNKVTIVGQGFTSDAEVFVDGVRVSSQLLLDGSLQVTMPAAGVARPAEIEVRTNAGSAVAPYGYFDPAETEVRLWAVSPASGPLAGGNEVTLVGSNLDRANLAVRFGGILAEHTEVISSNFVTATVPAGAALGPVDVTARVQGGEATWVDGYRYVQTIEVHAVSPGSGPVSGGTTITITGSDFPVGARVFVGALEATAVERLGATTITAVTPRGTDGPVPVRVVDPVDPSVEGILPAGFVYDGPFDVARISPTTGARAGGTRVTVRGSGFRPGLSGSFGTVAATEVELLDPFTAVVVAPRGEVGTVDVSVESGGGDRVTLVGAFTYFDPTNANGGASGGPLNGTLNVTVLDGGQARNGVPLPNVLVVLGTDDETGMSGLTDDRGQITFSSPALVKAQIVSAALDGYQSTTVVNQQSENLTIFLRPNVEPPECDNGLDDDGDGLIDWDGDGDPARADRAGCMCGPHNYDGLENPPPASACMCPTNPTESNTCCDGIDNDGDGLIDGDDPDCVCSGGSSEGPLAQCSNCKDDDGDGTADFMSMQFIPDSGCASPADNDERGAIVAGRVWGFKLPGGRVLGPDEVEEAQVRISVPSVYNAPPFGNAQFPVIVTREGGSYVYEFASTRYMAIYAVYGIRNLLTNEFEPLLMGVRRNVNPTPGNDVTDADIVLDMHLSLDVPVTIENPPSWFGTPGASTVFAYMDLGQEGIIPVGQASTTEPGRAVLENLPTLAGDSFVFQLWGGVAAEQTFPLTATFRRQSGDISQGITMGPLMGLTRLVAPLGRFDGVIEWSAEPGPAPEVIYLRIDEPTLFGAILQWEMIVPGTENRVAVPPSVLQRLRSKYAPGTGLQLTIIRGREPRFSYDQWNYRNLGLDAFTSFTYDVQLLQL